MAYLHLFILEKIEEKRRLQEQCLPALIQYNKMKIKKRDAGSVSNRNWGADVFLQFVFMNLMYQNVQK